MDIWPKEKRSYVMSRIRGKNTSPEKKIGSELFKRKYRFRKHSRNLPGKPDLVFSKYKTAVFVHGCFWHYHADCKEGKIPKTNSSYWKEKLSANIKRDARNTQALRKLGWKVIIVWECEIENELNTTVERIINGLK